jgi:tripartite-type tricarboxylate transporter receptor subunit TctC
VGHLLSHPFFPAQRAVYFSKLLRKRGPVENPIITMGTGEDSVKLPRRRFLHLAAGVAALPAVSRFAWAQGYPARPITMVVPFPAGGPTDTVGRIVAEGTRLSLGQPVIIENVTGAGGTIGVGRVARAVPDGYTLSVGFLGTHVLNGAIYTLQYDVLKDFEPVALLASNPQLIVAKNATPAKSLNELIAWLKANPGKASQGTAGVGSPAHVSGAYFQKETGTRFQFVPYRGAAPAMQDLIAGQIDLMFDQALNSLPHVRGGKIKAYAVTANTRLASAPEIPTVDEAGLPGFLSGPACGRPKAHLRMSSLSSMPLSWMPSPTRQCGSSLRTLDRQFHRATSRHRRRSAPFRRPRSRSGGRSSRPRASRRNEACRCR